MIATEWGGLPRHDVVPLPPFLGDKWQYAVRMNGAKDVAVFATMREASIDAARRNYAANAYVRPGLLGM